MKSIRLMFAVVLVAFFGPMVLSFQSAAWSQAPGTPSVEVPQALGPWVPWVMAEHEDLACALSQNERLCSWPTVLTLSVTEKGAAFNLEGALDVEDVVRLPGAPGMFPLDVRHGESQAIPVLMQQGAPYAKLARGKFSLSGRFSWEEIPKSLQIPPEVALVRLTLRGESISDPLVGDRGELWLKEVAQSEKAQEDSVTVTVFRRLQDGVPFKVLTRVVLRISGKARELELGAFLPAGSTFVGVESPLETRVGSDGVVRVRARPGEHHLTFESLFATPPQNLKPRPGSLGEWPEEEVWVWVPSEEFRTVRLAGATLIDPSRTELPEEWNGLTTYVVQSAESLAFEMVRRGEQDQGADTLTLARTAWLSLDGAGVFVRDEINGQMNRQVSGTARLNAAAELEVGRVSIGGTDQLITEDPKTKQRGVEIRAQNLALVAESKLAASPQSLPVVAWDRPMQTARLTLNLPPGWDLVHASGADAVSSSWVASWSLLEMFLVLLAAMATYRLMGRSAGLAVLAALLLLHEQQGTPQLIYFHLLAGFALLQFLPESGFQRFVRFHYHATLVLFGVLVATFSFHHLVQALYPSVLPPGQNLYGFLEPFFFLVESTFSGWIMFTLFIWGAQLFFRGRFVAGLLYGVGAIALAMVVGLSATFTGVGGSAYDGAYISQARQYASAPSRYDSAGAFLEQEEGAIASKMVKRKALAALDKNAVVQTGPGLPSWNWRSVELSWSGRVEPDYRVSLMLVGPKLHLVFSLARVALLIMILLLFVRHSSHPWKKGIGSMPAALAMLLCCFTIIGAPSLAQAQDLPSEWHLKQLEQRLLEDVCTENCLTLGELSLSVSGTTLRGEAKVSSRGPGAVALPGPLSQLSLSSVTLDGATPAALRREGNGMVWVRVPDGLHSVSFQGALRGADVVTLQFPVNPEHVVVTAPDWEVDGLSPTGAVQGSMQFTRITKSTAADQAAGDPGVEASSWITVHRELGFGLSWSVSTTITRSGNLERPEALKIKLLDGESVVTPGIKVEGQIAQVMFQRGASQVTWEGSLPERDEVALTATSDPRFTETWELRCSALWQCNVKGLAPERSVIEGESGWMWRPFPSEALSIAVQRPLGASGQSSTVDSVRYAVSPGVRALDATVFISVRASQGGFKSVKLPDSATLTRVTINGQNETTRYNGTSLSLPVRPGATTIEVAFSDALEPGLVLTVPRVEVDGVSANAQVVLTAPAQRWILLARGPGLGPIVLFWGKLLVVLLFAVLLGRVPFGPFGTKQWFLMGLGLATLPVPLMLIPVLWAWLIDRRQKSPSESRFHFNLGQIGLGVLTILVVMVLYRAVSAGLIMSPDMMILGYQSSDAQLSWYVDYVDGVLPQPSLVTAPLWIWRVVMLAWSTWLVFSLLGWLRWGYECLSSGGLWRVKPPK